MYRLLILVVLASISCKDSKPQLNKTFTAEEIKLLEGEAYEIFQTKPALALEKLESVSEFYKASGQKDRLALAYLNMANISHEIQSDYIKAEHYADSSLKTWKSHGDSLQMANLYKYLGYLNGLNDKFDIGRSNLQAALGIYARFGDNAGLAISWLNLSKLEFRDEKYELAEELLITPENIGLTMVSPFVFLYATIMKGI